MRRTLAKNLLAAYTLFMLTITLLIFRQKSATLSLLPFQSMAHDWRVGGRSLVVNFLGNIIGFMPFGILLPLARRGATEVWQAVLFAGSLSFGIEAMQYLFAGRNADIDDVLLNTLGGLLGYSWLRGRQLWYASRTLRSG